MDELYRVYRVAKMLDCSKKNVYRMIREGRLEAIKLGPRQTRVTRSSVERFLKKCKV